MTNLIVEISKYLMILLMAVYTYANFASFPSRIWNASAGYVPDRTGPCFAIHFLAYLVMFLKTEDEGMQAMLLAFLRGAGGLFSCVIFTCTACCTGMCPDCW